MYPCGSVGNAAFLPMTMTTPLLLNQSCIIPVIRCSTRWLTTWRLDLPRGYQAFFPSAEQLRSPFRTELNACAAFSHILAGYYAGLVPSVITIMLITPSMGPRSIWYRSLPKCLLSPAPCRKKNCAPIVMRCVNSCPAGALSGPDEEHSFPHRWTKFRCFEYHKGLSTQLCAPCGICANACPVGEDLIPHHSGFLISPEGLLHCKAAVPIPPGKPPTNKVFPEFRPLSVFCMERGGFF